MISGQDWYNLNGVRGYPLADSATRLSDTGILLPNDILVDCQLRFPESLGRYAFVSSLVVRPGLFSATFLACPSADSPGSDFQPLAAVTVTNPEESTLYRMNAFQDGVIGWVVLGEGLRSSYDGRFSGPEQSLLLPRSALSYRIEGVSSIRKPNSSLKLNGIIQLRAGPDVKIESQELLIPGSFLAEQRKMAIVFSLDDSGGQTLKKYLGPCGLRAESGSCDSPGVELINNAIPDCEGRVHLLIRGAGKMGLDISSHGLVLDYPLGLIDACTEPDRLPDRTGKLPNEFLGQCDKPYDRSPYPIDDDNQGETSLVASSNVLNCAALPYLDCFEAATGPVDFVLNTGNFDIVQVVDKFISERCQSSSSMVEDGQQDDRLGYVYRSTNGGENSAIWDNCVLYEDDPFSPDSARWSGCRVFETAFRVLELLNTDSTESRFCAGVVIGGPRYSRLTNRHLESGSWTESAGVRFREDFGDMFRGPPGRQARGTATAAELSMTNVIGKWFILRVEHKLVGSYSIPYTRVLVTKPDGTVILDDNISNKLGSFGSVGLYAENARVEFAHWFVDNIPNCGFILYHFP